MTYSEFGSKMQTITLIRISSIYYSNETNKLLDNDLNLLATIMQKYSD